jgi:WD40 repeat protein
VALSRDASRLAVCCRVPGEVIPEAVSVWETATGKRLRDVRIGHGFVRTLAFSPDGGRLAVGGSGPDRSGELTIWEVATGRLEVSLHGHGDTVFDAAFRADGRALASAGADTRVIVWDLDTGRAVRTFRGHPDAVMAVAFSSAGRRLASGDVAGGVRLWDAGADQEAVVVPDTTYTNGPLSYTADGRVAITSWSGTTLWAPPADRPTVLDVKFPAGAAVCAGGRELAVVTGEVGEKTVTVRDTATGAVLRSFPVGEAAGLVSSPDGTLLAVRAPAVSVWDTAGRRLLTLPAREHSPAWMALSPDNARLAEVDYYESLRVWEVATGRLLFERGNAYGGALAFSPDGRVLAYPDRDGLIQLLAPDGTPTAKLGGHTGGAELAFTPDGRRLVGGCSDGTVRLWDLATGQEVLTLRHGEPVAAVAVRGDGRQIASMGVDGTLKFWDAPDQP